jgi:dipeptidyl-peptidase-4|nr:S9 family peptidase [Bacteroides intestinalis]
MDMKIISKWMGVVLLASSALFTTNVMAQDLKKPTLEDLIPGGETYRFAENLYGLQWWGDTCIKPGIDSLFAVNPKTGKETLLLTREKINQALEQEKLGKLNHLHQVTLPWAEKTQLLISLPRNYVVYDWKADKIISKQALPEKAANKDYNITSGNVAYTQNNNLYVNSHAVTNEPEGIVCGQSVHRNEFGISKGTYWSPKGDLLAFYRMDESMVTQYPLVDITARTGELNNVRYPMAGMTSHKVTVGIYNPETQKTIYLNAGDPTDRYFTNISWAPDAKSLYLIELNRDQNHANLCQYNAETGERINTFYLEEKHPKYVEPQHPILFLPWDNTKFIFQSQRDGYNHLYLADTKTLAYPEAHSATAGGTYRQGCKVKQLTQGRWLVKEVLGFDEKKKELIFTATKESPLQSNLYKVNVNSGKITPLDNGKGIHRGTLSASGSYLIETYSSPEVPRSINLIATQNGKSINLLTAEDPFKDFSMPSIEVGTIKAADGVTDLYYRIIKPADFDPNKKYPTIIYVYGGPHAQMVTGGWQNGARGWDIYMANKGYIMFTLDNRGSDNRGLEFENVTFRHLGIEEGKDQVKGVEFLKSLPYVDGNRIGVHGWSFGGHMTTALMLRYPEIFKVGVAGGPVIDWGYYEIMYGERYMDTPQSNPEGYEQCNLKNLAGNLKGHLLLIHDDHDDTCVPQHTLSFIKACVDARTYPDLFIYPTHKHNVIGRDRVHLHEKITRYFEDNL